MMTIIAFLSDILSAPIQFIESLIGEGHPIHELFSQLLDAFKAILG